MGAGVNRPEQQLQKACADFMRRCVPPPPEGPAWTAINPSPAKSKTVAGVSKAMGLNAGWPDWNLVWRGANIYIEFKTLTGHLSEEQLFFYAGLQANGATVYVVCTFEEFQYHVRHEGIPTRLAA